MDFGLTFHVPWSTSFQGLSSYHLGRVRRDPLSSLAPGGKMRDPGNEVGASISKVALDSFVVEF